MQYQLLAGERRYATIFLGEAVRAGADNLVTFAVGLPEISEMLAVIDQIAEDTGFTKSRRSDIQVTVSEACAAIGASSSEKRAWVTVGVEADLLEVEIKSPVKFQLMACDDQPPACGTRLALIAALTDDFGLQTDPQGGTSLMMAFRLERHEDEMARASDERHARFVQLSDVEAGARQEAISFEFQESRRLERIETEFVSQLASVLSLALENMELCKRQQTLLDKLQQSYLRAPESHPEVQFAHDYRSATEGAHAGGDFQDLFMGPDGRVILVIGDVSGRGLEASRIAHMAMDGIRVLGLGCADPAKILQQVNRLIFSTGFSGFVTSFVAAVDYQTGEIAGASAGHPAPLLVDSSGATAKLHTKYRPPLGSFRDTEYESVVTKVAEGDILLLFTDGLTEARRDGELFGEERLMQSLKNNASAPLEELPGAILRDVLGFARGTIRDDAALLALKYVKTQPGANQP